MKNYLLLLLWLLASSVLVEGAQEETEEQPRPDAEGHGFAHLQSVETHKVGDDTRFTVGRLMMFERDADVRHSVLCQRSSIHPR